MFVIISPLVSYSAFMPRCWTFGAQSVVEYKTPPRRTTADVFEFDSGEDKEPTKIDQACSPDPGPSSAEPPPAAVATPPARRLCTSCDTLVAAANWVRHQRTHSARMTVKLPFPCESCGANFSRSSQLKRHHYRKHTPGAAASHQCEQCSKAYAVKENLLDHVRDVHRQMTSRTCPHCQHHFSRPVRLREHLKYKCLEAQAIAQVLDFDAAAGFANQAP